MGAGCRLGSAAHVGLPPQHLTADPDAGGLVIGDGVVVRETATVHRSAKPGGTTTVGDRCLVMTAAHVGHDTALSAGAILANGVLLGGHVTVGAGAFLGGGVGVHQFCRIGRLAIVSGNESVSQDVPPFAAMRYGGLKGYNAVGCRRSGMSPDAMAAVRRAYGMILRHRVVARAVAQITAAGLADVPEVAEVLAFVASTKRGVVPVAARGAGRGTPAAGGGDESGGGDE